MKKGINWAFDGWTVMQEADKKKHLLEIECFAEQGVVKQVRVRHSGGEEVKYDRNLGNGMSLPMPLEDFKEAFAAGKLTFGK